MQAELKELITKKDEIEEKIAKINQEIENINQVKGYEKGLVDEEGFPKPSLDFGELGNYRNLKRLRAELNNDHVKLMKQIQKGLFALHATYPNQENHISETNVQTQNFKKLPNKVEMPVPKLKQNKQQYVIQYLTPFARITSVQENSPAYEGGIRQGDLLSQFAKVHIYTMDAIKQIPRYVQEGQQVKIIVLRLASEDCTQKKYLLKDEKQYIKLTFLITPRKWEGRGLLGCKIDPF